MAKNWIYINIYMRMSNGRVNQIESDPIQLWLFFHFPPVNVNFVSMLLAVLTHVNSARNAIIWTFCSVVGPRTDGEFHFPRWKNNNRNDVYKPKHITHFLYFPFYFGWSVRYTTSSTTHPCHIHSNFQVSKSSNKNMFLYDFNKFFRTCDVSWEFKEWRIRLTHCWRHCEPFRWFCCCLRHKYH